MTNNDPIKVQEYYRPNGELKSIYQYTHKNESKKSCRIPKWLIGTASFLCAFILIALIAALVVVYFAPRHSLHQESCIKRLCIYGFGLKCINNTCLCESGYIYIDKCRLKKNYMEKCNTNILCKDKTNMICIDGVCKCDEKKIWNGATCINKSTFNQKCNSNEQCLEEKMLYCDKGKCTCDNLTRFWDETACFPKRTYNEQCLKTSNCREWENLSCINNLCVCTSTQYWDNSLWICKNKLFENDTCTNNYQCFSPMNCSYNSTCQCGPFEYHNITSLKCLPQKTHLELTCEVDYNCRVDRYLECRNGLCQCINYFPLWSDGFNKCIVPRTYSQSCYVTSECNYTQGLYCNDNSYSNCSCPKQLGYGVCDCVRLLNNNEYYWNGYNCVLALGYNQTCTNASTSYMCKTLLEGTSCLGPYPYKCKCQSLQYYNYMTNKCEPQLSESLTCLQSDACRSDLGLSCQIVLCQCNTSTHYWNGSLCVPLLTYNTGTCSSDSQCYGNLICRLTGTTCLCPLSVSNNKCDCPTRISGSEYYWNGYSCVLALGYNQTCTNASSSYMCKTLLEGTSCLGPYPYKCICQSLQYYNYMTNKCEPQLSESLTCLQSDACRSDLGLSCQIGVCKCNTSTHYWNGGLCVPLLTYNAGSCSSDSHCTGNLICRLTGATCLCPLSVSNNKCDCPTRVFGSEYYWNGIDCVVAASFNQTCSSANYTCQTITQLTHCDPSTQKCICDSDMKWSGAKCIGCDSGWSFYKGSCFRVSSSNIQFDTLNTGNIGGLCYTKTGVALAKVDNSYFNFLKTFNSKFFFDGRKISPLGIYNSSDNQFTFTHNSLWNGAIDPAKNCVIFDTTMFEEDKCDHNHNFLCEYVL